MSDISAFPPALTLRPNARQHSTTSTLVGADVEPKAPGLVLVASLLIPGLGQFINGERRIALAFVAAFVIAWRLVSVEVGIPMLIAVMAWSTLDAWADAKAWNREHGLALR